MTDINHESTENITCPKCGDENGDSGFEDNEGLNFCYECGTCFQHQREIEVTYSTSILEYPTPLKEPPKPYEDYPRYVFIIEDNKVTFQEWLGTDKQYQALQAGLVFDSSSDAEKCAFLKQNEHRK